MKVLFANDHKFCRGDDGAYYSAGQYPYRLWQRYLGYFDEIVVAGRSAGALTAEKKEKFDRSSGPRVRFIEIPNISGPVAMIVNHKEAARLVRSALMECDALIARNSVIGELAAKMAQQMKKPWALEVVSCPFDALWNYGNWQGKVYAPYAAYITRQLAKRAPYAIYVTRKFLQGRYPCRGRSIGCSDVQLINRDESVWEKRMGIIKKEKIPFSIGLIGSLSNSYKGIDVTLEALSKIKEKLPPFEFRILGAGNSEKWEQLAKKYGLTKQTVFCGTLASGTAVNHWLDDIDLYIQPSLTEGLPRALIEAMSRGCPALGSGAGGIPELLAPECIHKPGDSSTLAKMLETAILNKDWLQSQAARNFREAAAYDSKVLDDIRREFWLDFAGYCRTQKELQEDGTRFDSLSPV